MNHSNLKEIDCDNNELVPASSFQAPAPKLQLRFFSASSCTSKLLNVGFPSFLRSQYDLDFVDLSHNKFIGEPFPSWLVENNTKLKTLYLRNTSLIGPLQLPQNPRPNLHTIDLSNNNIHGQFGNFMMANNTSQVVFLLFWEYELSGKLDLSNNHMSCELLEHNLPRRPSLHASKGNRELFNILEGIDLSRNYFEEYFNFVGLEYLDLSENNLSGSLPLGFDAPSLRYVHLYRNQLSGPLPYAFYNLSSLVTLDLGDNNLTGPIPDWIDTLSELSIFVLKSNQFNGELPHQLCLLRRLSILDLSENNFSGHLPSCLSNLNFTASDEKSGYLYYRLPNYIEATRRSRYRSGDQCKNTYRAYIKEKFLHLRGDILRYMSAWISLIESLDLSHNNLNGRIPAQLIELTFLAVFNVSYNNLSGRTPEMKNQFATFDESSYKGNPLLCGPLLPNSCDKTESPSERVPDNSNGDDGSIDMDSFYVSFDNYFQVPISLGSFMNLSNLKDIECDNNELVPASSFQPSVPKLQLNSFSASNCISKLINVGFPSFLRSQYDLVLVDLSHNKFIGEPFPSWLVENNTKLNGLYLRNTSFIGPLQLPQNPRPNLQTIDLSDNNIHGQIARNACLIFPGLENFTMANNNLTGCIPPCFGNMSSLRYLDLSNNYMSCELFEHNLPIGDSSLRFLKLSNNNFNGRLTPSVFNMTQLRSLFLDGNKFVEVPGTVPLAESSLKHVDISNNLLSGMLPKGIGNSSIFLEGIDLSRNNFEGTIPIEYFNSPWIRYLDLSENNLSGSLPLGFDATSLRYVHLYRNQLSGPLPYDFFNLSSLVTLDLGDNNLSGPILDSIASLSKLSFFVLKSNQFNGELPHQLCLLRRLSILDLSENNFSGHLPSCLSNLNFTASDEKSMIVYYDGLSAYKRDSMEINVKISVELTSKKNFYTYTGNILRYMSILDLSCNRFTGEISTDGKLKRYIL
uniref:Leucine-rich repeat-containing N-terminal plant-type domain-containing protein n=1 Tax=Salix viminalis TaxID=40686 RepID=A0A6N2KY92_SALVM